MADGMSALTSAACYSPLESDTNPRKAQFRIATLLPGQWSERLRCQLSVHALRDPPPYQTISYAWGDPRDTGKVIVNDVELSAPRSLELCLRYLRSNEVKVDLWTDAICIDQSNAAEKASQVMQMGYIYRTCSSMYIWFGEHRLATQSDNPFEVIQHWTEDKHFYDYPGFSRSQESGEWVFEDNTSYQKMYAAFHDFISRQWWTRLWCVQEIALCPEATIVMGSWRIPWAAVLRAKENHIRHDKECCAGIANRMPAKYTYSSDHMLFLTKGFDPVNSDQFVRFLRHKLCKDPRDKIYGVLGLLGERPFTELCVDYSWSVSKLYLLFTKEIIQQANGDLQFLTGSGFGSSSHQMPSWVRDFAAPLDAAEAAHEHGRYKSYNVYDASAGTKSDTKVIEDRTLSLSGKFVDCIESVGTPLRQRDWVHIVDTVQSWAEIAGPSILGRGSGSVSELQEQFWRTILADYMPTAHSGSAPWRRIATPTGDSVLEWYFDARERLEQGFEPLLSAPLHALWVSAHGNCFFRTEKGHFGLCFPHTKPGDEVWVLAGGKVPFVLRHLSDAQTLVEKQEKASQGFQFVGECYLHGFMDGEAFRSNHHYHASVLLI